MCECCCQQAVDFATDERAVLPYHQEVDVALPMHHRCTVIPTCELNSLGEAEEHPCCVQEEHGALL